MMTSSAGTSRWAWRSEATVADAPDPLVCKDCGAPWSEHVFKRRDPKVTAFEAVAFGRTVLGELIHPAPKAGH